MLHALTQVLEIATSSKTAGRTIARISILNMFLFALRICITCLLVAA